MLQQILDFGLIPFMPRNSGLALLFKVLLLNQDSVCKYKVILKKFNRIKSFYCSNVVNSLAILIFFLRSEKYPTRRHF